VSVLHAGWPAKAARLPVQDLLRAAGHPGGEEGEHLGELGGYL
jgi:hypothetical protein